MAQEPLNRSWSILTREVTLPEVAQQISPSRTDVLDDSVWRRYKMGGGALQMGSPGPSSTSSLTGHEVEGKMLGPL